MPSCPADDDNFDFNTDDTDSGEGADLGDGADSGEEGAEESYDFGDVSIEDFDTSEMDGLDFGIPETDSQLKGEGPDFELGNYDDFSAEGEFEIPGFSDVDTAKDEKITTVLAKGKTKEKGKGKGKKSKKEDIDCEQSLEYAKDRVWEGSYSTMDD